MEGDRRTSSRVAAVTLAAGWVVCFVVGFVAVKSVPESAFRNFTAEEKVWCATDMIEHHVGRTGKLPTAWTDLARDFGEVNRGYGFSSLPEVEAQVVIDFAALNRTSPESAVPPRMIVRPRGASPSSSRLDVETDRRIADCLRKRRRDGF
jgi:hypothetical protein